MITLHEYNEYNNENNEYNNEYNECNNEYKEYKNEYNNTTMNTIMNIIQFNFINFWSIMILASIITL